MDKKQTIESRDYAIIGKLHAKTNPSDALTLLQGYKEAQEQALDTDLDNLFDYYWLYCENNDINPLKFRGALHNREKVEKRRIFIGAMVRIYKPQLIAFDVNSENGLASLLGRFLKIEAGNLSNDIHKVIVLINNNLYGYTEEIENIAKKLVQQRKDKELGPSLFEQMEVSA